MRGCSVSGRMQQQRVRSPVPTCQNRTNIYRPLIADFWGTHVGENRNTWSPIHIESMLWSIENSRTVGDSHARRTSLDRRYARQQGRSPTALEGAPNGQSSHGDNYVWRTEFFSAGGPANFRTPGDRPTPRFSFCRSGIHASGSVGHSPQRKDQR
jgi:hypothetical protein